MQLRQTQPQISHWQTTRSTAGFTIIEMLVAVSIFAIVMVVGVGTLIVVIRAGSAAQSTQTLTSNLSFVLDSMSRKLRTGYSYYCRSSNLEGGGGMLQTGTRDCSTGATAIIFTDGETGGRTAYRLNAGVIEQRIDESGNAGSWIVISSSEADIQDLTFVVNHTNSNDNYQPQINILLHGVPTDVFASGSEFYIQTTVTSRSLDV